MIATEANFIISSLPNAESPAVERIVHQLDAIRDILLHLEDPASTPEEIGALVHYVESLLHPLEQFLASPPPPANAFVPRQPSTSRGRPAYILDLDRATELHRLGISWGEIAKAMGVTRQTLYNHMATAGLTTSRPPHSELSDEELDALITDISQAHPFSGCAIIQGHLESRGIHVARVRVQESLRRVDAIGVLVR